jgi:hypothetical protein
MARRGKEPVSSLRRIAYSPGPHLPQFFQHFAGFVQLRLLIRLALELVCALPFPGLPILTSVDPEQECSGQFVRAECLWLGKFGRRQLHLENSFSLRAAYSLRRAF